jgi:type VI secretion system secreted protein Hcp
MDVILMKMTPDVQGESTRPGLEGQIELLSFSHAVAMQVMGDPGHYERTAGRPVHQDFAVTKNLDRASPLLNEACCKGSVFGEVKITAGRSEGNSFAPLITYTLKNVIISAVSTGGGLGGAPVESLTLNYGHITWDFNLGQQSSVRTSWDVANNRAE